MNRASAKPTRNLGTQTRTSKRAQHLPKDERREQLLEFAREIVSHSGTDALTMATLARQAGVSKPVVYEHFENSEAVTLAMLDNYFEEVVNAVDANTSNAETLDEYISGVIDVLFDFHANGGLDIRKLTNGHTNSHATGDKLNAAFNESRKRATGTFKELLQQQGVSESMSTIAGHVLFEMLSNTAPEFAASDVNGEARKTLKLTMLAAIHAVSPDTKAKPRTPEWILEEAERIRRAREN